jgi:hypothetical protein
MVRRSDWSSDVCSSDLANGYKAKRMVIKRSESEY